MIPVLLQELKLKAVRRSLKEDGLWVGFEPASQQAAIPLPEIDVSVIVSHHRHHGVSACHGFGDQIVMLAGMQWNVDFGRDRILA